MDNLIWLGLLLFIIPFAFVPFLGAPYVPSKSRKLIRFLQELGVKSGQVLLDLGSGDGTVLKHSAKQLNLEVIGIELNPFLVAFSRIRLAKYRKQAKVIYGNFWTTKIPPNVDVIYIFLIPKRMDQLEKKIRTEISKTTLVVTYSFTFNSRKPHQKSDGFYAYKFTPLAKK